MHTHTHETSERERERERETHAYPVERASAGSEHAIVSTLSSSALPYGACATRESFGTLSDDDEDDDEDEADKGPLVDGG